LAAVVNLDRELSIVAGELDAVLADFAPEGLVHEARERAYRRGLALRGPALGDGLPPQAGGGVHSYALVAVAADMLAAVAAELVDRPADLRAVIDRSLTAIEVPRAVLARETLRARDLFYLPRPLAIDVPISLLGAFASATAVSLWAERSPGCVVELTFAGDPEAVPADRRALAQNVIARKPLAADADFEFAAIAIERADQSPAALLMFATDALSPDHVVMIEAAVPALCVALLRDRAVPGSAPILPNGTDPGRVNPIEQELVTSADRRLARLRFDLHDGPQQDLTLLAEDLRLFRHQLESVVGLGESQARLLGRVDDLQAQLVAIDGDVRRISLSVQSPFLHRESFEDALGEVVAAFTARTGVQPEVRLGGDFARLTDSQYIALLGVLREALSNAREHSEAMSVRVVVTADDTGLKAEITDDGRGFDPETTLVRAARDGHLGLVGMHERVRLLGGTTTINSRPGGPTVISVALPPVPIHAPRRPAR
jgi:signal transduction histidine kinase